MKSKITIDTIKSESARFQIENYTTDGMMLSLTAISAVVKAERDAEERAVTQLGRLLMCHTATEQLSVGQIIELQEKFKQLLNNGGQSDENN